MALSTVSPRNMSCQNPNTCTLKALSYRSQQRVIEALGLLGVIDWNPNCVKPAKTSSCYPLPFRWNSPVFQLWCGEHNGVKYGQMHSSSLFPVLIPVVIRLVLTGINLLPWCHRRWPRWLQCFASRHGFSGILWWWSGCTMLDPNGSETYWSSLGWFRTRWNRERKCLQWFFFQDSQGNLDPQLWKPPGIARMPSTIPLAWCHWPGRLRKLRSVLAGFATCRSNKDHQQPNHPMSSAVCLTSCSWILCW